MLWSKRGGPSKGQKGRPERIPLEKGDLPALVIAALITLLPAVLLVGGLFALAIWVLFLR